MFSFLESDLSNQPARAMLLPLIRALPADTDGVGGVLRRFAFQTTLNHRTFTPIVATPALAKIRDTIAE